MGHPPGHRLFAKLALRGDGEKTYLPATPEDVASYAEAERALAALALPLPKLPIEHGHNTRQILAYGYRHWRDAFNARQLLGLARLARAITHLEPGPSRDALGVLFSGTLEFNNLFASYKGEGTGAVRHMFSHHILKPERTPIEANPWGTPKSSGAFSTLYRTRLLRALDYRERPFEIGPSSRDPNRGEKRFGLAPPLGAPILDTWPKGGLPRGGLLLDTRDARTTGLPDRSVDLVITDPPYFDNVHYSELADFFAAWTETWGGAPATSTRVPGEVQDVDAGRFARKLRDVLRECARVLRDEGLLVLSYQHARDEGWRAVGRALAGAGFALVQAHPVKAELSRSAAKARSKSPADIDILLVGRKSTCDSRRRCSAIHALRFAARAAEARCYRYRTRVHPLSEADARAIVMSQLLVALAPGRDPAGIEAGLAWAEPQVPTVVRALLAPRPGGTADPEQLDLFGDAR
jgi:putative DNA methylase